MKEAVKAQKDLAPKIKRYEAGLAKIENKKGKTYKRRSAELKELKDQLKANKIILIYKEQYEKELRLSALIRNPEHKEKRVEIEAALNKQALLLNELQTNYQELSNQKFPEFVSEYRKLLNKKKQDSRKRQR